MERAEGADQHTALCKRALKALEQLRGIPVNPQHKRKVDTTLDSLETLARALLEANAPLFSWGDCGLTRHEEEIAGLLHGRLGLTFSKEAILASVYFDHPVTDWPDIKIIDVFVCKLRKKLVKKNVPFRVETDWGRGYRMVPADWPEHNGVLNRSRAGEPAITVMVTPEPLAAAA